MSYSTCLLMYNIVNIKLKAATIREREKAAKTL